MASKCLYCGDVAVDDEDGTCRACGIVTDAIRFGKEVPDSTPHVFYSQPNRLRSARYKAPPVAWSYGLTVLRNLCHLYNISSEKQAETVCLLEKAYRSRKFGPRENVGFLAGCCLLLVQRKHGQFISISDLRSKMKCGKKKFSSLFKFLKDFCHEDGAEDTSESDDDVTFSDKANERNPSDSELPESVEALVPVLLEKIPEDEKKVLIEKTKRLAELANSCWLLSGRSPRGVVIACAFLCWKSMDPSRKNAAFTHFSSQYCIQDRQAVPRIPELLAMLLKLGSQIPSFTKDYVNKKNVLFHLNYILENSETLRNDLLEDEHSVEAINCKEYNSFRITKSRSERSHDDSSIQYDPDMRASDIEISDSEINSYIRTEEHIKFIEKIKNEKKEENIED